MKVCEELDKPHLNNEYKNALQRSSVSDNMLDFARAFAVLQAQRHLADYDPGYKLAQSDASDIITVADFVIASFEKTLPTEQADVLALMMIKNRA